MKKLFSLIFLTLVFICVHAQIDTIENIKVKACKGNAGYFKDQAYVQVRAKISFHKN